MALPTPFHSIQQKIPMPSRSEKKTVTHRNSNVRTHSTRDLILDVAEELFASRGYVATSIRMIAKGAKITLGNLHYHFPTKESLYLEVFQRCGLPLVDERISLLRQAKQKHS